LAPVMAERVPRLRRFEELTISDGTELALIAMSPATMDRRLAPDRAKLQFRGRSHTKPGSLLKDASEFINWHLLRWCEQQMLTFTRSRPGNSNDGAHVEQKNWAVVRTIVGYLRYDTTPELLLLNQIWKLQSLMTNFFYPQQKLVSKVRNGAKVTKTYDRRDPAADSGPHRATSGAGHRQGRRRPQARSQAGIG